MEPQEDSKWTIWPLNKTIIHDNLVCGAGEIEGSPDHKPLRNTSLASVQLRVHKSCSDFRWLCILIVGFSYD